MPVTQPENARARVMFRVRMNFGLSAPMRWRRTGRSRASNAVHSGHEGLSMTMPTASPVVTQYRRSVGNRHRGELIRRPPAAIVMQPPCDDAVTGSPATFRPQQWRDSEHRSSRSGAKSRCCQSVCFEVSFTASRSIPGAEDSTASRACQRESPARGPGFPALRQRRVDQAAIQRQRQ